MAIIRPMLATILLAITCNINAAESPLTPYVAEYQVNYGSIGLGKARYQLFAPQNKTYTYKLDSDISLLMLSDKRSIRSTFKANKIQLTPIRYSYKRSGTGSDYHEQAAFAIEQKLVYDKYKNKLKSFVYNQDLYDPLMAQLQFRLDIAKGQKTFHYELINSGKIKQYDFRVVGKERIKIASGSYDTVKIEVIRKNKKRVTLFWIAPALGYLPIRLTHSKNGKNQLDLKLLSYHFEPQPAPKPDIKLK